MAENSGAGRVIRYRATTGFRQVSPRRENEEPFVREDLERGTAVGDDGDRYADLGGGVAQEPIEVFVFDPGVSEEENEVGGAVFGDDPLGRSPTADAAVLQNPTVS